MTKLICEGQKQKEKRENWNFKENVRNICSYFGNGMKSRNIDIWCVWNYTHLNCWSTHFHLRHNEHHLYKSIDHFCTQLLIPVETRIAYSCSRAHHSRRYVYIRVTSHLTSWNIHHCIHTGHPIPTSARSTNSMGNRLSNDKRYSSLKLRVKHTTRESVEFSQNHSDFAQSSMGEEMKYGDERVT